MAGNFGTDFAKRTGQTWLDRGRATDENHAIIRTLRAAQLDALPMCASASTPRCPTNMTPTNAFQHSILQTAERLSVPRIRTDRHAYARRPAGRVADEASTEALRQAVVDRLPADFDAALAGRHGVGRSRDALRSVAEGAVLDELRGNGMGDVPPLFLAAFERGQDSAGGWFSLFVRKAAAQLRAGGEFERIWNAEQTAVIRLLAEQTDTRLEDVANLATAAAKALRDYATTLDAIAGNVAATKTAMRLCATAPAAMPRCR